MKKRNKKGTVELSLNLIIMLIIGLVVLGLVISFVTSLITKGKKGFNSGLNLNDIKFLNNLESSCSQNFCVQSSSNKPINTIKLSGEGEIGIFLKNYNTSIINCDIGPINSKCTAFTATLYNSTGGKLKGSNYLSSSGMNLKAGQGGTTMITFKTKDSSNTLPVGTYYLKIAPIPSNQNSPSAKTVTIQIQ